ncbi:MAG: kynureninase [Haloglomus sp.]
MSETPGDSSETDAGADRLTREWAERRDAAAWSLADAFDAPGTYMEGNSLGPISDHAERAVEDLLAEWRELGVEGWSESDWFEWGERLGARVAPMVGARTDEVALANSTTVNIHTLVGTFLRESSGTRVLVNELDFPSDHYAVRAQLRERELDPDADLVQVPSRDGRTIRSADVEAALADHPDVGVVLMPSVLYRSGQLLDVEAITEAAHAHDAVVGFDCAHSVGVVPHAFAEAGVDFAVWCGYKYLNGGPGAVAGLYVHRRHHGTTPSLAGWWGHEKETQFEMREHFTPADSAGAWQIGTPPLLAMAPLRGVLDLLDERDVSVADLRERSLALTDYLIDLADARLPDCEVTTPRAPAERGGHVALSHPEAYGVSEALAARDVVVDYRPPDVVRLCPGPTHVGFADVWDAVDALRAVLDEAAYEGYDAPDGVT